MAAQTHTQVAVSMCGRVVWAVWDVQVHDCFTFHSSRCFMMKAALKHRRRTLHPPSVTLQQQRNSGWLCVYGPRLLQMSPVFGIQQCCMHG